MASKSFDVPRLPDSVIALPPERPGAALQDERDLGKRQIPEEFVGLPRLDPGDDQRLPVDLPVAFRGFPFASPFGAGG